MRCSELIEEKQKAKGEKIIEDPDADAPPPKGSNVIDLMAALKKSLGDRRRQRQRQGAGQEEGAAAKKPRPGTPRRRNRPRRPPADASGR